MEKISAL